MLCALLTMACERAGTSHVDSGLRIAIVHLGYFSDARQDAVEAGLRKQLQGTGVVVDRIKIPSGAYYPPRSRYRADRLVDMLARRYGSDQHKVLGLTEADISTSTPKYYDYGIFGLGELSGRACVVSINRLRRRLPPGKDAGERKLRERMIKVCVHEVGHTLGLDHCQNKICVMAAGEGSVKNVDESSAGFCPRCIQVAAGAGNL